MNRFALDAGNSSGPGDLQGARYLWAFSDGTTAEGQRVTHDFAGVGAVQARLTVLTAQGTKATDAATLLVPAPDLVHFDPLQGRLLVSSAAGPVALPGLALVHPAGEAGWALPVGAGLTVPAEAVQSLSGARDFDLRLRLQRTDSADPGGEILRIHPMMILTWEVNLGFAFRLRMADDAETALQTRTPRLDPGRWYDIRVEYDAATGVIALSVDGKLAARARVQGPQMLAHADDLTFGNPFGQKSFDGVVSAFDLCANQTALIR